MGVSDSFLYVGRHPGEQQIVPGALSWLCSGMPGHFQNTLKWGVANTKWPIKCPGLNPAPSQNKRPVFGKKISFKCSWVISVQVHLNIKHPDRTGHWCEQKEKNDLWW